MKLYRVILFISTGLLFLATLSALSLPYGYFTFLRLFVFGTALFAAFQRNDELVPFVGLLMVAALFNPFVPVHLPQPAWRIVDLATAGTFIRLAFKPLKTRDQE